MRRLRVHLWPLIACSFGCEGVEPARETGGGESAAVLLAEVALTRECDRVGAVEVQLRARRIGCEGTGPCTLPAEPPEISGDRATCPSAEPTRWMGVEIDRSGRYLVDVIVRFATGEAATECLADAGDNEVLVTSSEVDAGAERILEPTGSPCPSP